MYHKKYLHCTGCKPCCCMEVCQPEEAASNLCSSIKQYLLWVEPKIWGGQGRRNRGRKGHYGVEGDSRGGHTESKRRDQATCQIPTPVPNLFVWLRAAPVVMQNQADLLELLQPYSRYCKGKYFLYSSATAAPTKHWMQCKHVSLDVSANMQCKHLFGLSVI